MKKLLTLAALLGTATLSFGQGYVSFANTTSSRISNNGVLQPATTGGSYYYALLVAPSTQNTVGTNDGSFTGWTYVTTATNIASAGRLNGNKDDGGNGTLVNAAVGGTADFVVVGWSANIGSDWTSVSQGFHGSSSAGTWTVSNASAPGGASFAWFGISAVGNDVLLQPIGSIYNSVFSATAIPNMNLGQVAIPEPTTFALAGLGAAALVIFRRRKV